MFDLTFCKGSYSMTCVLVFISVKLHRTQYKSVEIMPKEVLIDQANLVPRVLSNHAVETTYGQINLPPILYPLTLPYQLPINLHIFFTIREAVSNLT